MGKLTDDMTRLRGEIETLRGSRGALRQELVQGVNHLAETVSMMRSHFTTDLTMRATKAKEERNVFVFGMIKEVDHLLEDFCKVRENWARMGRETRGKFLLDLRKQVTDLRKDTADDLTGARLAWKVPSVRKSGETQSKKATEGIATLPPKEKEKEWEQSRKLFQESTLKFKRRKTQLEPKTAAETFPDFIIKEDPRKKDKGWLKAKTTTLVSNLGKRKK